MISVVRTDVNDKHFIGLVERLDQELADRDGTDHTFYAAYNTIEHIEYAVVAYDDNVPVGCGALKAFNEEAMEIKRMFVCNQDRGKGIATRILIELESWTRELTYSHCILETGKRQPEAINLYRKNGYERIENFGQYVGVDNSLCFKKRI